GRDRAGGRLEPGGGACRRMSGDPGRRPAAGERRGRHPRRPAPGGRCVERGRSSRCRGRQGPRAHPCLRCCRPRGVRSRTARVCARPRRRYPSGPERREHCCAPEGDTEDRPQHGNRGAIMTSTTTGRPPAAALPDERGRFGQFGGTYAPVTLLPAIEALREAYAAARRDPEFQAELERLLATYGGRPTALYYGESLSREIGGAQIYLKREDLAHTGAHKINNALGQGLLAKRMGKPRVIAETGAGQHGVATATVCAMLGLECVVYMGE